MSDMKHDEHSAFSSAGRGSSCNARCAFLALGKRLTRLWRSSMVCGAKDILAQVQSFIAIEAVLLIASNICIARSQSSCLP